MESKAKEKSEKRKTAAEKRMERKRGSGPKTAAEKRLEKKRDVPPGGD
jgi:hypothetical protein